MAISGRFERDGIKFQFPTNWLLEEESTDDGTGWLVTLFSPATAFLSIAFSTAANAAEGMNSILNVLRHDYPDLESEPHSTQLGGTRATGFRFDFLTFDTTVSGWAVGIDSKAGPLLVLAQVGEYDREQNESVLYAIAASITIE